VRRRDGREGESANDRPGRVSSVRSRGVGEKGISGKKKMTGGGGGGNSRKSGAALRVGQALTKGPQMAHYLGQGGPMEAVEPGEEKENRKQQTYEEEKEEEAGNDKLPVNFPTPGTQGNRPSGKEGWLPKLSTVCSRLRTPTHDRAQKDDFANSDRDARAGGKRRSGQKQELAGL